MAINENLYCVWCKKTCSRYEIKSPRQNFCSLQCYDNYLRANHINPESFSGRFTPEMEGFNEYTVYFDCCVCDKKNDHFSLSQAELDCHHKNFFYQNGGGMCRDCTAQLCAMMSKYNETDVNLIHTCWRCKKFHFCRREQEAEQDGQCVKCFKKNPKNSTAGFFLGHFIQIQMNIELIALPTQTITPLTTLKNTLIEKLFY